MESYLVLAFVFLSFPILILPKRFYYYYTLFLASALILASGTLAVSELSGNIAGSRTFTVFLLSGTASFTIDALSAFFILVINFTTLTGLLFSKGYLEPYFPCKNSAEIRIHYFSLFWLYFSMLCVVSLRKGLPFLISWELMGISSFMLVLFEGEKRTTLKTAVSYLVQMHIGFFFLLAAFLVCYAGTGSMSFDALRSYFSQNNNFGLFILFFLGFGIKAGFIPLHTWLPDAHPAAPSHVSGIMSGVMIKMGIYGILRTVTFLQHDIYYIGLFVLGISTVSGLLAVMMAIIQHDLKKLLAYHSIENIGIIGMGTGLGIIGLGINNPVVAMLGFAGGILHVLNHSLFKSLLFFSSGSVYKNYHTRNIEQLGGVIHKMPVTAFLFLVGALAISGLPPLNGFISEALIYFGLFRGLTGSTFSLSIVLMLSITGLVLIGGLAIFCFTKAFSIVFLGTPRSENTHEIREVNKSMLFPQYLIVAAIVFIGFFPFLVFPLLNKIVASVFHIQGLPDLSPVGFSIMRISLFGFIFTGFALVIFYLRYRSLKSHTVATGPTWGCGYTAPVRKQEYTGTSYANNFYELLQPVVRSHKEYKPIRENEIFPGERSFVTHPLDVFKNIFGKITDSVMMLLKYLARLQTGHIQHYIMYAFIFILLIFAMLYFNLL